MKVNTFDIVLTSERGVYFSGQTIQGHVILELAKSTKVKGIRLVYQGKAFVHWTEQAMRGPGESRMKEIRHHSATELYFDVSQPLLSRDPSQQEAQRTLEAGQYTYPFQFSIPAYSPTSFEGQFGFVRYWVKVTIERPWKSDASVKKLFSVICPVDLNLESTAGPVSAGLRLSQKGYVPGETLLVHAEVNNLSRRKMGSTSVELLMTTTFHTPTKSRSVTHQVARLHHGSLCPGTSDWWEGESLVLPSLPPSYMIGCSIIDVKYTLELRVFPVGPAFALSVPLDIVIGTVPLHSTLERYLAAHQMTPPPVRPQGGARGGASVVSEEYRPPPYLPPTYSSSAMSHFRMRDDEDEQCTLLDNHYSPRYINFNFQLPQLPPPGSAPAAVHHHLHYHPHQHTVRFAT